jgi:hypothetical protein
VTKRKSKRSGGEISFPSPEQLKPEGRWDSLHGEYIGNMVLELRVVIERYRHEYNVTWLELHGALLCLLVDIIHEKLHRK